MKPPPVSPFYGNLGKTLQRIRRAKNLSLDQVSRLSGGKFSAALLGSYERGHRRIGIETLYDLAAFYAMPVEDLLPDDVTPGVAMVALDDVIARLESLRGVGA